MTESWRGTERHFGNWSDPEIIELMRANQYWLSKDLDPEVWSEPDWQEFERDRLAFERYHAPTIKQAA